MYYYDTPYFGMHFMWWVFWAILWVSLFSFWTPVPRRKWRTMQETPLSILQSRLARGELNEVDYERCKAIIERDAQVNGRRAVGAPNNWRTPAGQ
jgi:putative membrane protein